MVSYVFGESFDTSEMIKLFESIDDSYATLPSSEIGWDLIEDLD